VCIVANDKIPGTSDIKEYNKHKHAVLANPDVRYEVIGGNHLVAATKKCLEQATEYNKKKFYKQLEATIYVGLTDLEAMSVRPVYILFVLYTFTI
jgi:hypothetical protein